MEDRNRFRFRMWGEDDAAWDEVQIDLVLPLSSVEMLCVWLVEVGSLFVWVVDFVLVFSAGRKCVCVCVCFV